MALVAVSDRGMAGKDRDGATVRRLRELEDPAEGKLGR